MHFKAFACFLIFFVICDAQQKHSLRYKRFIKTSTPIKNYTGESLNNVFHILVNKTNQFLADNEGKFIN